MNVDDEANVAEEIEQAYQSEEALFVEPGKGIEDNGCTSPVMGGEEVWSEWLPILQAKGLLTRVITTQSTKVFRFGNGTI